MASFRLLFFVSVLPAFSQTGFLPASECAMCHTQGQHALWKGSMMARAPADPFWRAKVKAESRIAGEAIESKCLRCHAPTQQVARVRDLAADDDGVSCTVCHRILPAGLGKAESFTGGFAVDMENRLYGPHADPFEMPMLHHVGKTPTEGRHVLDSALCGSCHTVITHDVASGKPFLEQAPYLEWLASDFAASGKTCQSCHVPVMEGKQYIAHRPPGGPFPPTSPRQPFGRHLFAGGNAWMGERERSVEMLGRSADLTVTFSRGELAVRVLNRTGHKLPTGFPARRMWLHVRATGPDGRVLFESGAWNARTGELSDGQAFQPHRQTVGSGEVIVWEAEYLDAKGAPTEALVRAAAYRKDNRLLPAGFDVARVRVPGVELSQMAPAGVGGDADFAAGGDAVRYRIAGGVSEVLVELCFQSVKPRYLQSLDDGEFVNAMRTRNDPVVIARQRVQVD